MEYYCCFRFLFFLFVVDHYFYTKSFLDCITGNESDFDYLFLKQVCLTFLGLRASALSTKCCCHLYHGFCGYDALSLVYTNHRSWSNKCGHSKGFGLATVMCAHRSGPLTQPTWTSSFSFVIRTRQMHIDFVRTL